MSTMSHRNGTAERARHAKLEQLLSQQDTVLRSHKQILREGLPTATSGVLDAEEHSMHVEEQGVGFSLVALRSQRVREIETALGRLVAGDFGTCSDCRSEISDARLRAQPFATLCLACRERQDMVVGPRWSAEQHQA